MLLAGDNRITLTRGVALLMATLLFTPTTAAFAQSYDLGSTSGTVQATQAGVIKVGGTVHTIRVGDMITPAEFAALNQITSSGRQNLNIGASGSAIGGRLNIGTDLGSNIGSLVIPQNVNALGDFSKLAGATFTVPGNLTNSGNLYGYSTSAAATAANFQANSILNNVSGLISTVVPFHQFGITNALQSLDLNLTANDIANFGAIKSSGSISLLSNSGRLTNAGSITAARDINISAPADLVVNNTNGVIGAANNINVREAGYSGANLTSIMGGDLLSKQINIHGGQGDVETSVNNVTGVLNTTAGVQHFVANTQVLKLGNICIDGDPTYANVGGNVSLAGGAITVQEALSILASGNISSAGAVTLTARTAGGVGQPISLIAGANLTLNSGTSVSAVAAGAPPATATADVSLNGASATGGSIILSSGSSIISSGTGTNAGGDVLIAAYGGSSSSSGTINLGGSSITTTGAGGGAGGALTVIGGSNSNAITIGNIDTSGGSAAALSGLNGGAGGAVSITTAQPTFSSGTQIDFATNGSITSANTLIPSAILVNGGSIITGSITTSGGAGGSGAVGAAGIAGGAGTGVAGTAGGIGGAGGAGGNAGAITLSARSGLTTGAITGVGGAGGAGGTGGAGGAGGSGIAGTAGTNGTVGTPNPTAGGAGNTGGAGAAGGTGGAGGAGGMGAAIVLNTTNGAITLGAVDVRGGAGGAAGIGGLGGAGGAGGVGGAGGAGLNATTPTAGAIGGVGGAAGAAGTGGNGGVGGAAGAGLAASITSIGGGITLLGLNTTGGAGGLGGTGGVGGTGGTGGAGGAGGKGGNDTGGPAKTGFAGAAGGAGGNATVGGNAGSGGAGGVGANAGTITISSTLGDIAITGNLLSVGGVGGGGGTAGKAGNGGVGGAGGAGGAGGTANGGSSQGGNGGAGAIGGLGRAAGTSGAAGAAAAAGNGNNISVSTLTGAIQITGNVLSSGGVGGAGGTGAQGANGGNGGAGGAGGAGGGTGGGGSQGGNGGNGGNGNTGGAAGAATNGTNGAAGGTSGTIVLDALRGGIAIIGDLISSGGAGGAAGAGGSSTVTNGSGGNGANGGSGGAGNTLGTNGIGGTGGTSGNGTAGAGPAGQTGGAGGAGSTPASTGGNGTVGASQQPNSISLTSTSPLSVNGSIQAIVGTDTNLALLGGGAGSITLSGSRVALFGAGFNGSNVYGGNGITITAPGGASSSTAFLANLDLSSTSTTALTIDTTPFAALGAISAYGQSGSNLNISTRTGQSVTINGTSTVSEVNTNTNFNGSGDLTIYRSDGSTTLLNGNVNLTPAEYVSAVQASTLTGQTLIISPVAAPVATGGKLVLTDVTVPGSLTALVIPANVTANVSKTTTLTSTGTTTIDGTLAFQAVSPGNLTVPGLTIGSAGIVSASFGSLTVVATGGNSIVNGGVISALNNVTLTTSNSGTISGAGTVTAPSLLTINLGTSGSSNVNSATANLTFSGNGANLTVVDADDLIINGGSSLGSGSLSVSSTSGNLVLGAGAITADGGITLGATTAGKTISGAGVATSSGALTITLGNATTSATVNSNVASLNATSSGGSVTVTEADGITLNNGIALGAGSLTVNSTAGSITVGSAGSDTVVADGGITLGVSNAQTLSGSGTLQSTGTVTLNVGSSGTSSVKTAAGSLAGTGSGGNVTVAEADAVTLNNGINYAGGSYTVNTTNGNVTVGAAGTDTVIANGGLTVGVTGSNTISGSGRLQSTGTVTLNIGNNGASIVETAAGSLTGSGTGGQLTVNELNAVTLLNGTDYQTGSYTVTTSGAITLASSSSDTISAQTLTLNGGSITGSGVATGTAVTLAAGTGSIGSAASRVNTNASSLALTAALGSVYVNEADGVDLTSGSAGNDFVLAANGDLNVNGDISADPVFLRVSNGNINLNANITADGGILIVGARNINVAGNKNIDGRSTTGNAGAITMVAGASFVDTPGTSIVINGASAQGGNITFNNGDTLRSSSTAGSGGNITLAAFEGAGGGAISMPAAMTITTGGSAGNNNGSVTMVAGSSANSTNLTTGAIDTTGGNRATGSITLSTSTPNTPVTIGEGVNTGVISAGSFLGGAVQANSSMSTGALTTNAGAITLTAGNNLTVGNIVATSLTNGTGGAINLTATNGALNFPATITSQGTGVGNTGGSVTTLSSTASGASTINVNGAGGAGGGSISIRTTDAGSDLTVGSQLSLSAAGAGGSVSVRAGNGVTVDQAISVASLTLRADGANGIAINAATTGTSTVDLISSGGMSQTAAGVITTNTLSLTQNGVGNSANLGAAANSVNTLNVVANNSGESFTLNNTGALTLNSVSGTSTDEDITVTAGPVSLPSAITITGDLTVNSDNITVAAGQAIEAGNINFNGRTQDQVGVGNPSAGAMQVNNYGTLFANGGDINIASAIGQDLVVQGNNLGAGIFQANAGQQINIEASDHVATAFHPNLYFTDLFANPLATSNALEFQFTGAGNGTVNLTADGGSTNYVEFRSGIVEFKSSVGNLNFNCCNVVESVGNNAFFIAGPPTVVSVNCPFSGTIANSTGTIDLSTLGSLTFTGTDLAILSAGSIINTGAATTLDLSSGGGAGGNLLLVAGFDFDPQTVGTVGPDGTEYTLRTDANNTRVGSIILNAAGSEVAINTSGGTSGGTVKAYANGAIAFSTVNTSGATGAGGSIDAIGGGITTDTLTTTGATGNGAVTLTSGNANQGGGTNQVVIKNGVITSANFFQAGPLTGNVSLGGGSTGALTVTGGSTVTVVGALNSNNDNVSITGGDLDVQNSITAGTGSVTLTSTTGNITGLGTVNAADVTLDSFGDIYKAQIGPAFTSFTTNASNSLTVSAGNSARVANTANSQLDLDASAVDTLNISNVGDLRLVATASSASVDLSSSSGSVLLNGNNVTGTTDATILAANDISGTGTVSASQVSLGASGNIFGTQIAPGVFTDISTNASNTLLVSASGFAQVSNSSNNAVDLEASAVGALKVTNVGGINLTADATGNSVTLTSSAGGISLGSGNVVATTTADLDASGTITGPGTVSGTDVSLTAGGDIFGTQVGPTFTALGTNASNSLTISSGGSATVSNIAAGQVDVDASATNELSVATAGSARLTNTFSGGTASLNSGDDVLLNGNNVSATTTASLTASDDISGTGTVSGTDVGLSAGGDIFGLEPTPGTFTDLSTNASSTLTVNATGLAQVANAANTQIGLTASTGGDLTVSNVGSIQLAGNVSGANVTVSSGTGDIHLNGKNVTANSGFATLDANGDLTDSGLVTGTTVNLTAGGDIYGTEAPPGTFSNFTTNASSALNVSAGGFAFVSNASASQIDLDASATGALHVTTQGTMQLADTATGDSVRLESLGGSILMNGNDVLATTTAALIANTDISGTGNVSGSTVSLNAGGNILASQVGPVVTPFSTSASNTLVIGADGFANVANTAPGQIDLDASATGDLTVSNGGNIQLIDDATGANVSLTSTGADVLLNGNNVTATTNANVQAFGSISGTGTIGGANVSLLAQTGDIFGTQPTPGNFTPINTNATSLLTIQASGKATVNNVATTQIDLNAFALSSLNVTNDGSIRLVADADGSGVTLTSTNGSILLNGFDVDGGLAAILNAGGDISGTGTITGAAVGLSAGGDIYGTQPSPGVFTDLSTAASLSLAIDAGGDAHVINTNNGTVLLLATAGGALSVTNGGDIQLILAPVTGDSVDLTSSAGSILLNGQNITATTAATLTANNNITGTGLITAPDLTLVATTGDIYETNPVPGSFTPLTVSADTLDVTAGGSAYVSNNKSLSVNATVGNAGTFDLTSSGSITIDSGNAVSGGTVNLTSTSTNAGTAIELSGDINATDVTLTISGHDAFNVANAINQTTGEINSTTLTVNSNDNTAGDFVSINLVGNNTVGSVAVTFQPNTTNDFRFNNNGLLTLDNITNANSMIISSDSITVASSFTGLTLIDLTATTGDINTNGGVNLSAVTTNLTAADDLSFGGDVTGTTTISLSAGDTITQAGGTSVNGGALTLQNFNGPLMLSTNVDSLSTSAATSGEDLVINEASGITLNNINVANLTVNASGTTDGDIVVGGAVNVTGGDVVLTNQNTGGMTTSGSGVITANGLALSLDTGTVDLHTDITHLDVASSGDVTVTEANDLTIDTITGDNVNIIGTQGVNATFTFNPTSFITGTGAVVVAANNVRFNSTVVDSPIITGDSVVLSNFPNDNTGLTIIGTATIGSVSLTDIQAYSPVTGPQNNLTFGSNPTAPNPVTDITFVGTGSVNLVSTGNVQLMATTPTDTQLTSGNTINVFANDIVLQGLFNAEVTFTALGEIGTISNPTGDVVLPTNLNFPGTGAGGKSLAILAQGNIRAATKVNSINLSNKFGSGGNLLLVAGYDFHQLTPVFQPAPNATSPVAGIYVIDQPSTQGGSILLPKVNINVSSSTTSLVKNLPPTGGTVTAIASAPSGFTGASWNALNTTMGTNSGAIALGTINTSANKTVGNGGAVTLIGQGGVQTGAINASGANGGNVTIIGSAPELVAPGIGALVINGVLPGATFGALTTDTKNGAAVFVNGAINTSGAKGQGGEVFVRADQQIQLGAVTTTGFFPSSGSMFNQAGGNFLARSDFSSVTVGNVNTSALSVKTTTLGGKAGDAGNITLLAQNNISSGALKAVGGANTGTGDGGAGGVVTLETNLLTVGPDTFRYGTVTVKGSILTTGGSAAMAGPSTANGGVGGNIIINAGNVIGTSINAAAGKNAKANVTDTPAGGLVTIHTYSAQALPLNLDLTSKTASISQLPGGMLSVGLGGSTNGFSGTIVTSKYNGTTYTLLTNNKANMPGAGVFAGQTNFDLNGGDDQTFHPTGINEITFNITNQTGGLGPHLSSVNTSTGKRNTLTPSAAVQLYQTQRGQSGSQIVVTNGTATSGTFVVDQIDTNGLTFTAFKIPSPMVMQITGDRPSLNLPGSTLFGGTVSFTTPDSIDYINLNGGALSIGSATNNNAKLLTDSSSTLILSGTGRTYNNFGTLSTGNLVLARPTTAGLTFIGNLNSTTDANKVIIAPSSNVGTALTFRSLGAADFVDTYELGNVLIPTMYKANAIGQALNASVGRALKLTFSLSQNTSAFPAFSLVSITPTVTRPSLDVSGDTPAPFSATSVSISTLPSTVKPTSTSAATTVQTPLNLSGDLLISASSSVVVGTGISGATMTLGNSVSLTSTGSTVTLKSTGATINQDGNLTAAKGVAVTNTVGTTNINGDLTSSAAIAVKSTTGAINVGDFNTLTSRTNTSVTSTSGIITFGDGVDITAGVLATGVTPSTTVVGFPSNVPLTASQIVAKGSILVSTSAPANGVNVGDSNFWISNGGNIVVTSKVGNIAINDSNHFTALGGNVQLLAKGNVSGGLTNIVQALGKQGTANGGIEIAAGTTTSTLAAGFAKHPVIGPSLLIGAINIASNTGVFLTTSKNPGVGISMGAGLNVGTFNLKDGVVNLNNGGTTSTINFQGGDFQTNSSRPIAFISPAMDEMNFGEEASGSAPVEIVDSEGAMFRTDKQGALVMHRGEVLMEATDNATIKTIHAVINAKRGALVHIVSKQGKVYIKACTSELKVTAHGVAMTLPVGQELLLSVAAPTQSDLHPSDGVGRRKQNVNTLADGTSAVVSDFSMISLIANLPGLHASSNNGGRKVIDRMLKTAAAIDVVTRAHGNYTATPKEVTRSHHNGDYAADAQNDGILKPVSYRSAP